MKKAIFPGSFDPITKGHEALVLRGLELFDEIIIAIGTNSTKKYMYSLEQRMDFIKQTFANEPRIKVESYEGLTTEYCKKSEANFMLRGLRTSADFEFERAIAQINRDLQPELETVFLITSAELSAISSSIIRDIIKNNGDAAQFLPDSLTIK
ncbi:pantetheine-phosphate adenylyltransferase [Flavobacteriales bacterium]|jgi:pantetheine-phosphate adenylyltransferase|nr:pantetheine-phosphate adenylyltransferase [Flavobacteriales bacterium]MDB9931854.1 pantetheine-phosphate adenylyltransferase [Flavobacteriales bacterium]